MWYIIRMWSIKWSVSHIPMMKDSKLECVDETLVNTIDRDGNMLPINMINGLALTRDPLVVLVSFFLTWKSIYSPSVTSFANADMAVRQRPHQKKYKLRTGCVNVSYSHKPGNKEHTKATTQETCDSWRKRCCFIPPFFWYFTFV